METNTELTLRQGNASIKKASKSASHSELATVPRKEITRSCFLSAACHSRRYCKATHDLRIILPLLSPSQIRGNQNRSKHLVTRSAPVLTTEHSKLCRCSMPTAPHSRLQQDRRYTAVLISPICLLCNRPYTYGAASQLEDPPFPRLVQR